RLDLCSGQFDPPFGLGLGGLAFGVSPLLFRVAGLAFSGGRRGGFGGSGGEPEPAASENDEGGDAADQQWLVGCAFAHHWAPSKGARPLRRARAISARTRARRASTAADRALTRAVRVTRNSTWEMRPDSKPIR